MASQDEQRSGLADAAGRAAFFPARAAARAWREQLEAAVDEMLSAPEIARVIDRALAGPLPEEIVCGESPHLLSTSTGLRSVRWEAAPMRTRSFRPRRVGIRTRLRRRAGSKQRCEARRSRPGRRTSDRPSLCPVHRNSSRTPGNTTRRIHPFPIQVQAGEEGDFKCGRQSLLAGVSVGATSILTRRQGFVRW